MSILKLQTTTKRQIVKMSLDTAIYQQIQNYCKWANLERPAEFVERAAEYIFAKDEKWKNRNRPAAKTAPAANKAAQQAVHKKPVATLTAGPSRKRAKSKPAAKQMA